MSKTKKAKKSSSADYADFYVVTDVEKSVHADGVIDAVNKIQSWHPSVKVDVAKEFVTAGKNRISILRYRRPNGR